MGVMTFLDSVDRAVCLAANIAHGESLTLQDIVEATASLPCSALFNWCDIQVNSLASPMLPKRPQV
jgi:hypothetical protein